MPLPKISPANSLWFQFWASYTRLHPFHPEFLAILWKFLFVSSLILLLDYFQCRWFALTLLLSQVLFVFSGLFGPVVHLLHLQVTLTFFTLAFLVLFFLVIHLRLSHFHLPQRIVLALPCSLLKVLNLYLARQTLFSSCLPPLPYRDYLSKTVWSSYVSIEGSL